jgi:hypothetical protein
MDPSLIISGILYNPHPIYLVKVCDNISLYDAPLIPSRVYGLFWLIHPIPSLHINCGISPENLCAFLSANDSVEKVPIFNKNIHHNQIHDQPNITVLYSIGDIALNALFMAASGNLLRYN